MRNRSSNGAGASNGGAPIKVLMQNRPTAFTQRGGDTVVLEKTCAGLQERGLQVIIDLEARQNPAHFDLVHLFNFATPDLTRALAERAHAAGVPFVVTTLNEDIPRFHNQSVSFASHLIEYVKRGQDAGWYKSNRPDISRIQPCTRFENTWTANHAAALFSNGAGESQVLRKEYPGAQRIVEIKLGHEIGAKADPELFFKTHALKDFIFCVGRFESRKNQLMLLKALEDCELPLVLAGGGFTYQPEYDQAVRNFRRKGKTVILERVSPEMLASAYASARVHALASWYELPGLVSLEAAHYGCSIVATDTGTTADYFGSSAFYCQPDNAESIYNAVMAAYYAPKRAELRTIAAAHSWDVSITETIKAYRSILNRQEETQAATTTTSISVPLSQPVFSKPAVYDLSDGINDFQDLLERGELAARSHEYVEAHDLLARAAKLNPASDRVIRAQGAICLAEQKVSEAFAHFQRAYAIDPKNSKNLCGMAMCEIQRKNHLTAYDYLLRALDTEEPHQVALLQLMECAYVLERFTDLERVLRAYLKKNPEDIEMKYCLAGCLYKQGDLAGAGAMNQEVLARKADHRGALELKARLDQPATAVVAPVGGKEGVKTTVDTFSAPVVKVDPPAADKVTQAAQIKPTPGINISNAIRNLSARLSQEAVSTAPRTGVDVDQRLQQLEECKRERKYDEVRNGCGALLQDNSLNEKQNEQASALMAETMIIEGDLTGAEMIYDRLLRSNPGSARAWCGKGVLYATRSEVGESRHCFEKANEANPDSDVALAGLGMCAAWNKSYEEAWAYYRAALGINPENIRALYGLVEIGYLLQRMPELEEAIRNYLDAHPADLNFIYSLAGCCYAQGKMEEAASELEKVLLFDHNHKLALELKEVILADRRSNSRGQHAVGAR